VAMTAMTLEEALSRLESLGNEKRSVRRTEGTVQETISSTSNGCVSPYVPIWINKMARRQGR
jgi:hypothetical protein